MAHDLELDAPAIGEPHVVALDPEDPAAIDRAMTKDARAS